MSMTCSSKARGGEGREAESRRGNDDYQPDAPRQKWTRPKKCQAQVQVQSVLVEVLVHVHYGMFLRKVSNVLERPNLLIGGDSKRRIGRSVGLLPTCLCLKDPNLTQ